MRKMYRRTRGYLCTVSACGKCQEKYVLSIYNPYRGHGLQRAPRPLDRDKAAPHLSWRTQRGSRVAGKGGDVCMFGAMIWTKVFGYDRYRHRVLIQIH